MLMTMKWMIHLQSATREAIGNFSRLPYLIYMTWKTD